ncbi:MAG: gamma-glutamylcyclotransferase [Thermoplasmata archaeon]
MAWVFGYGSLMWNPFFPYLRRERAVLPGYHRGFVMAFRREWGRPGAPCAVLGLERGGRCGGVAYKVEASALPRIEERLRSFEGEAFEVTRRRILVESAEVEAMVALNRPGHADYLGRLPATQRVAMVVQARGSGGTCLDYVRKTAEALGRLGIEDPDVLAFLEQVEAALKAS